LVAEGRENHSSSPGDVTVIRLRLFGRCRIYHDPVSPVLRIPAQIGWEAWFRSIDLGHASPLKGEELLLRTRAGGPWNQGGGGGG